MYGAVLGGNERMGICENEGCAEIPHTYGDMRRRMFRHFGNQDENPYVNNNKEGELIGGNVRHWPT